MSDLTEFLLARIAEDEAGLGGFGPVPLVLDEHGAPTGERKPSPRVLAECEAKRQIVTLMGYVRESWENRHAGEGRVMWPDVNRREKMHALTILETLATPYADHPDYREEWKP